MTLLERYLYYIQKENFPDIDANGMLSHTPPMSTEDYGSDPGEPGSDYGPRKKEKPLPWSKRISNI